MIVLHFHKDDKPKCFSLKKALPYFNLKNIHTLIEWHVWLTTVYHLNLCLIKDKTDWNYIYHSCMRSPLAPDPITVQSCCCCCCLFWTNRNSMAVTSIIFISHYPIRDMNLKLWWYRPFNIVFYNLQLQKSSPPVPVLLIWTESNLLCDRNKSMDISIYWLRGKPSVTNP